MEMSWYFWILIIISTSYGIWFSGNNITKATSILGSNYPAGIRGATFNAIASSIPEFFSTIFFLIILKDENGFNSGLATSAGSSLFNILIIPSVIGFLIIFHSKHKLKKINNKVIIRDGIFLLIVQSYVLFCYKLKLNLNIYTGFFLTSFYFIYVYYLSIKIKQKKNRKKINRQVKFKAIRLLVINTIIIGFFCYLLVMACLKLSSLLNIDNVLVAFVLTAGATSIPDAIISCQDALKGKLDDAISNVFGSNIFDICIAVGLPLLVYTMISGPIQLIDVSTMFNFWVFVMVSTLLSIIVFLIKPYFNFWNSLILFVVYFLIIYFVI